MNNKHGHKNRYNLKAIRKFSSLEVWRLGGIKRQFWRNFTCPDFITLQASKLLSFQASCKGASAFTMAEILISLTIIGVIAAITLPSLRANINESAWATQRKALYSRMSQALSMLPAMNGYGQYQGEWASDSVTATVDTAAETFVTQGLAQVLKIKNICDNQHFSDCGLPDKYAKFQAKSKSDFPKKLSELIPSFVKLPSGGSSQDGFLNPQKNVDTKAVGIETQNGESIAVFYNPYCVSREVEFWQTNGNFGKGKNIYPYFCAAFLFDLNGRKGPNIMGKDMWQIVALYSTDTSVVMLEPDKLTPTKSTLNFNGTKEYCASQNARLANVDEGIAGSLSGLSFAWLSGGDTGDNNKAYLLTRAGALVKMNKNGASAGARCIKR